MNRYMSDYYYELDAGAKSGSHKIAWCTSVGPAELLRGMGFLTAFSGNPLGHARNDPDGHRVDSDGQCDGYSPEICSYLTADVGAF